MIRQSWDSDPTTIQVPQPGYRSDPPKSFPATLLATLFPASQESIDAVLALTEDDDGRSAYTWVRLANGDLMLALFPHGEGYFALETLLETDFLEAQKTKAS